MTTDEDAEETAETRRWYTEHPNEWPWIEENMGKRLAFWAKRGDGTNCRVDGSQLTWCIEEPFQHMMWVELRKGTKYLEHDGLDHATAHLS